MSKNFLYISGLVLTILGLMGMLSKFTKPAASYVVLGLGLVLLIASYLSRDRKR